MGGCIHLNRNVREKRQPSPYPLSVELACTGVADELHSHRQACPGHRDVAVGQRKQVIYNLASPKKHATLAGNVCEQEELQQQ
ncbi:hypothetical protein HGM15179_016738 [Zosterops borbonicus]|uniref:Uncharacterized protein n=1 Tax=Zosterops borbonicus TaxID=364589 RepID=A0A8K1G290_9PASS|nr:hypothetical protein HGM15179_016738 [Zosterops borbonicus]